MCNARNFDPTFVSVHNELGRYVCFSISLNNIGNSVNNLEFKEYLMAIIVFIIFIKNMFVKKNKEQFTWILILIK
jgi:hypothetical protein